MQVPFLTLTYNKLYFCQGVSTVQLFIATGWLIRLIHNPKDFLISGAMMVISCTKLLFVKSKAIHKLTCVEAF